MVSEFGVFRLFADWHYPNSVTVADEVQLVEGGILLAGAHEAHEHTCFPAANEDRYYP